MTWLAFTVVAGMMLGQQPAPLVTQTELPPPAAVQQQAPPQADQPPAQQVPQSQFAPQQQPQETGVVPPVKPSDKERTAGKTETKGPGVKRVVAFWVILPDKSR